MPDRRTREGVEIARVGTFKLSTGPWTFTRAQLAAAAKNAETRAPKLGIGHTDPRFDGDPAFGKVVNLRLDEDGDVLLGDFADVPSWLDDNMDVAYPARSLEGGAKGDDLRIDAVKLLGTTAPGITTLKDLERAIAASVEQGETSEEERVVVTTMLRAAGVSTDDLTAAYRAEHPPAKGEDGPWTRQVRLDPDELIVTVDEKNFRVPWSVNADGTFTFGDPVEVVEQWVDVAASGDVVYQAPVTRPTQSPQEESDMDPKTMRKLLGLAEDASAEDVEAKLTEMAARKDDETIETEREAAVAAAREEVKAEVKAEIAASASKDDDGKDVVKLDPATYDDLKASAELGKQAHERQQTEDRERFIAAAIEKGKFPPSRKDHYLGLMGRDPDGTREFIDGLEENVVPVQEVGVEASAETDQLETTGWFPQLATQEA